MLQMLVAALLISGAAICTVAQSSSARKENTREKTDVTSPADGDSSRSENAQQAGEEASTSASSSKESPSQLKAQAKPTQYSYDFSQPVFLTSHILIEHDENGVGKITFERKNSDPIVDPLDLSPATIARLKALWETLNFLTSDKGYQSNKKYPHLGINRLHMKQDTHNRQAVFDWTDDRDAFALITEYKRIANQAIFIFDITLARENQPLEAPKLMDQFAEYVRRGDVSDAHQMIPLLRELTTDERIPLMARNRAARILKKLED